MDVMSPQQEHLGPGRSSSVSGESRVFAAADSKKKMKSLAQRRQSAPSLIFVKALNRSRSVSREDEYFMFQRSLIANRKGISSLEGCFSPISPEACPLVQSFMCHNRTFLLDGHVQLKTGLQTQERHLFLFTDLLVVAKSKENVKIPPEAESLKDLGPSLQHLLQDMCAEQKETWLSFLQRYFTVKSLEALKKVTAI
ncbi:hypothetical protein ASZ78_006996 [Callipepla squamata]|uniref:ARHGAP20 PH domain-containing protein n=1 Tax=Callipepla squamata TaxID=9009 RepID=A0A226MPB2_CALSU|nr:hypothetical protein ASZ78_006996 [Callipepla squamata]